MDVFPAYAGMIPHHVSGRLNSLRVPRVCGDDPDAGSVLDVARGCSPRTRG